MLSTIFIYLTKNFDSAPLENNLLSDLQANQVTITILKNPTFPDTDFKQEETLFISDHADFLSHVQHMGYFATGFSQGNDFLPVQYVFESFSDLDYSYFNHILQRYLGNPITIYQSKNLLLRELANGDLPSLFHFCEAFRNTPFIDGMATDFKNFKRQFQAYISNVYPFYDFGLWGVFSNETQQLIGLFGLQNTTIDGKEEIELGYLLDIAYRGKGYAKEAILSIFQYAKQNLTCHRIVAKIHKENAASIATALSCGMQFEKTLSIPENHALYVINLFH